MNTETSLPEWAKALSVGKIEIDAEVFYPEIISELWDDKNWPKETTEKMYEGLQREVVDQYWAEVAFQVAKMDIQSAVSGSDLMPKKGGALLIIVKDGSKAKNDGKSSWAQINLPKKRDPKLATTGKEARNHYKRIRALLF